MGKKGFRKGRRVIRTVNMETWASNQGAVASDRRRENLSMCWGENLQINKPAGMSNERIKTHHTKYYGYFVYDQNDLIEHFHMGQGRPFATCCMAVSMGCNVDFGLNPITVSVGVPEDLRPSNTPVLGMCCCVTCLGCVYQMPVLDGKWRPCRACGDPYSHEAFHLMYPVTLEGVRTNTEKAKKMKAMLEGKEKW